MHFFDAVHNLVSVTLKEAADQFITIVKDATAIDNKPGGPSTREIEGVTLDAWARQVGPLYLELLNSEPYGCMKAIYNHALSAAKISRVVENISDVSMHLVSSTASS